MIAPSERQAAAADPFGTAELRRVVLDAWVASPARFREDANAEEALVVGGYAGRVLVELASNAVDAAREAGVPARIRIRIVGNELRVANTGAPLTTSGVAALSSLRASAKRETLDSVGHFGVGFTAVLSWTSAPRVLSSLGGVRFAADLTGAAIEARQTSALDREVSLRDGRVPILRLPWPVDADEEPVPAGYATEVRLPLDDDIRTTVDRVLADPDTAEDLFWALTDLAEIDLPSRVVRCGIEQTGLTVIDDGAIITRYRTADRFGELPADLLVDRPVEERGRARWRITWALPVQLAEVEPDDLVAQALALAPVVVQTRMIGAPTPTDEPITLPARLVGTFPVDDTRRRLADGPLTDYLLEQAADTYLDLVAATEPADRWTLVPAGGFPVGPVDGAIRAAIMRRLVNTPVLATALGDLVRPAAACQLPGLGAQGAVLLGEAIPGLLAPQPMGATSALRGLGVSTLSWSQASAALAGIDRDPSFWWHVYEAIAAVDRPPDAEDLADIPVPLTGGRRALGARGCLLPGTALDLELAQRAGQLIISARIVHPAAVHPLLERLGARPADPGLLLAEQSLVDAVMQMRAELDDDDPDPDDLQELAELVLDLIAAGGSAGQAEAGGVEAQAFAGELLLTDADGRPSPAGELFVPGAPLAAVLTTEFDQPLIGPDWTDRYSTEVLTAVGVQFGFGVVVVDDPPPNLPDIDEWWDQFGAEVTIPFTALVDLDLVDDHKWPQALEMIATDRRARACLVAAGGTALTYSGWWISRFARIGGRRPADWRLSAATDLAGLFDPLPLPLDPHFARSIGVQAGLAELVAAEPAELLDRLADPRRLLPPGRVGQLTATVVTALRDVDDLDLPSGVRALTGEVVDAADAMVLDLPWLVQVLPVTGLVPGGNDPALVARVFDLQLASTGSAFSLLDGRNSAKPSAPAKPWPARVHARLANAAAAIGLDLATVDIRVSDSLRVIVDKDEPVQVSWWGRPGSGPDDRAAGARYWVDGSTESCGRVVAWAAGAWAARHRAIAAAANDWPALGEDSLD
ncbi:MAG: molecular chaperone Hsp90 [Nakamurella sp.]